MWGDTDVATPGTISVEIGKDTSLGGMGLNANRKGKRNPRLVGVVCEVEHVP